MDYRKVYHLFSHKPDGRGFAEDPGELSNLFQNTEAACFQAGGPPRVEITRAWQPLGDYFNSAKNKGKTRRDKALKAFEGLMFAEAAFAAMQLYGDERRKFVEETFAAVIPEHLQSTLFGQDIDDWDVPSDKIWYRKGFRLAWTVANLEETISIRLSRDEEFERIAPSNSDKSLKDYAAAINFGEFLPQTDYNIRSVIQRHISNSNREQVLSFCQEKLAESRRHFTAVLKATTGL